MSSSVFLGASHAARRVACYGMRSHQRESVQRRTSGSLNRRRPPHCPRVKPFVWGG